MTIESVREAISALVRSLGYAVATFASAEDFLESDRVDDTSCLITDVQMPGLSGVELQSRLIADGRHMPIIGVTAHPEESIRTEMLRAGAIGFLSKPFNDECLIDCLTTALKSRATANPQRIKQRRHPIYLAVAGTSVPTGLGGVPRGMKGKRSLVPSGESGAAASGTRRGLE